MSMWSQENALARVVKFRRRRNGRCVCVNERRNRKQATWQEIPEPLGVGKSEPWVGLGDSSPRRCRKENSGGKRRRDPGQVHGNDSVNKEEERENVIKLCKASTPEELGEIGTEVGTTGRRQAQEDGEEDWWSSSRKVFGGNISGRKMAWGMFLTDFGKHAHDTKTMK